MPTSQTNERKEKEKEKKSDKGQRPNPDTLD